MALAKKIISPALTQMGGLWALEQGLERGPSLSLAYSTRLRLWLLAVPGWHLPSFADRVERDFSFFPFPKYGGRLQRWPPFTSSAHTPWAFTAARGGLAGLDEGLPPPANLSAYGDGIWGEGSSCWGYNSRGGLEGREPNLPEKKTLLAPENRKDWPGSRGPLKNAATVCSLPP